VNDRVSELAELYRGLVMDHSRMPRHFRAMPDADATATGNNPLCGDRLTVYVKSAGGRIADIAFDGAGCAISMASASMMTEALNEQPIAEAQARIAALRRMLEGPSQDDVRDFPAESPLNALRAVRRYPTRVKCATLAWVAAESALAGQSTATTE
jgi:nitrogen fixation NifU-like protein